MAALLRQIGYVAVALMLGIYAFVFFRSPHGWPAIKATREKIQTMQEENDRLQKDIEKRRALLQRTAHDETLQRRAVRKYTGKAMPDDVTVILPPEPSDPPPAKKAAGDRD
jgi:hypothetical protein